MEADSDHGDSTYGTSIVTDTTSIKSSILNYRFEHGRRYHAYKEGSYLYPNDEQALNQMDIEHHNQNLLLGRLHLSPLENPLEVLDLGTGTGIWAIDMADTYPDANVLGIDLSPTQPDWVPPNVKFEVDDFREEWYVSSRKDHDLKHMSISPPPQTTLTLQTFRTFGENRFDYVHGRCLIGSLENEPELLRQALNSLKPGGWFEQNEVEVGCFRSACPPRPSQTVRLALPSTDRRPATTARFPQMASTRAGPTACSPP